MLLIPCPWCGARAETEFSYAGEGGIVRPKKPAELSDQEWAEYVYYRKNPKGTHHELWLHAHGCGKYFRVVRDTLNNKIHSTTPMDETPAEAPQREEV